jgi:hypothetical protein
MAVKAEERAFIEFSVNVCLGAANPSGSIPFTQIRARRDKKQFRCRINVMER